MDYFVYILSSYNRRTVYVGVTNNLPRRVYEHKNHLLNDSFTARYHVDRLVYYESTSSSYEAISREKQLKGWNRERKNKLIEAHNPNWDDLYETIL